MALKRSAVRFRLAPPRTPFHAIAPTAYFRHYARCRSLAGSRAGLSAFCLVPGIREAG
jgi:hypothetical protein